jgi:DNA-binding transcriptional ArsR family regulator
VGLVENEAKRKRAGQRGKSIEEVVEYAVSHRTRVRILTLLNQGTYSPAEISEILDIPVTALSHHIRELVDAGSIELARVEKARNVDQHYYRGIEIPFYSDEEVWEMTPLQRQISAGLIIQNIFAEIMAAFWGGKIRDDPHTWLAWRWFTVDPEGRKAIADEQQRFWERIQEIEAEATGRRIETGEKGTTVIVSEIAFERERQAPSAR